MAVRAANVVLQVSRAAKIAVLFPVGMARKAALARLFCGSILEREDL